MVDGETGFLIDYDAGRHEDFSAAIAEKVGRLLDDPVRARAMGEAGRKRVLTHFGWPAIARTTADLYASLLRP